MSVTRFSISMEKPLLEKLDKITQDNQFPNRSRTIRFLVNQFSAKRARKENQSVAGAIILVYNHHQRELQTQSTHLQHDYHKLILSVQHVHLDSENCLETLAVKGRAHELEALSNQLISLKGMQYGSLVITGTL